jgi:hypothetical protein
MGTCKYCGQSAGFLRKMHAECEQKNIDGKRQIVNTILEAVSDLTKALKITKL